MSSGLMSKNNNNNVIINNSVIYAVDETHPSVCGDDVEVLDGKI